MARWTILQTRDLTTAINEAIVLGVFAVHRGAVSVSDQLWPPQQEKPLDTLKLYQDRTIIKNGANPALADIDFEKGVVIGKFIDIDRSTCDDRYAELHRPCSDD